MKNAKSKLISRKIVDGNEVNVYRHPIIAGMQFTYNKQRTKNNELQVIGYYDYEIIYSQIGETLSEKRYPNVFTY